MIQSALLETPICARSRSLFFCRLVGCVYIFWNGDLKPHGAGADGSISACPLDCHRLVWWVLSSGGIAHAPCAVFLFFSKLAPRFVGFPTPQLLRSYFELDQTKARCMVIFNSIIAPPPHQQNSNDQQARAQGSVAQNCYLFKVAVFDVSECECACVLQLKLGFKAPRPWYDHHSPLKCPRLV